MDLALVGGAEALSFKSFAGFHRLGALASGPCRPFDADRDGLLTGEGAAILVLESLEAALARGARIYAEVLGYGLSCDAFSPVAPQLDGVVRSFEAAHRDAGVRPGAVDAVFAHGTGTRLNDITCLVPRRGHNALLL